MSRLPPGASPLENIGSNVYEFEKIKIIEDVEIGMSVKNEIVSSRRNVAEIVARNYN